MRIKISKHLVQGVAGGYDAVKVMDIKDGAELPEGAEEVDAHTPLTPWTPEDLYKAPETSAPGDKQKSKIQNPKSGEE